MAQSAILQWVGFEPRQTSRSGIITIKITTLLQGQDFHHGTQFTVLNSTVKQIFYAVKHQCDDGGSSRKKLRQPVTLAIFLVSPLLI